MRMLIVDALALALYLVVSLPALTGIGLHEWLGLGVGLALLVHQAVQVPVAGDEAEKLILRTLGEEAHIVFFGRILGGDNGVGLFIVDLLELVDVGAGEAAVLASGSWWGRCPCRGR